MREVLRQVVVSALLIVGAIGAAGVLSALAMGRR